MSEAPSSPNTLGAPAPATPPTLEQHGDRVGWRIPALVALALVAVNVWCFRDIYAGRAAFPWDFRNTYHAIPFHWQTLVRIGRVPEWMPYQAVGYPLQLPMQSGLYYPPLWLFPIFRILYTVEVAAMFQCLHVLAGALGMVWLARVRGMSWLAATLAGLAYQYFGGFFCNAEHPDIVRGYALLPLLLATLTLDASGDWRRPPLRFWVVPLLAMGFGTGVYPGQLPPVLALAGLYLVAQVFDEERPRRWARAAQAGAHGAMLGLGLLLALPHLGPAFLLRGEVDRSLGLAHADGLTLNHLFTTVFGYDTHHVATDVSMNSFFVTIPVLAGLFFVPRVAWRRHRALLALLLPALAMIPAGVLYRLVIYLLPPLSYSRFPIADYRALLAVPAVLLGVMGLERVVRAGEPLTWRDGLRATALLGFLALAAHRFAWRTLPEPQGREVVVIFAVLATLIVLARIRQLPPAWLAVVLGALIVLDGSRMHGLVTTTWKAAADKRDLATAKQDLHHNLRTELTARPARAKGGWLATRRKHPNLDGYLRGRFVADDFAVSEHLRAVFAIQHDEGISRYVYAASQPKLFDPAPGLFAAAVAAADAPTSGTATPKLYEPDLAIYQVSAPGDRILVENEPAFAGWRAFAHCGDRAARAEVQRVPELWPLRAWRIPAGDYRLCIGYRLPGLRSCLVIAGLALAAWLGGAVVYGWRRRRQAEARLPAAPAPP